MAEIAQAPVLIVPGLGSSGPQHWQSRWQARHPHFVRVAQRNWDAPDCGDWIAVLEQAVFTAGPRAVLVAHSLGCLLVAHWARQTRQTIAAAMLVAVPDPQRPDFPASARGFAPVPRQRLPFRTLVVASSNDPYGSLAHANACASAWVSRLAAIGAVGHINADSDLGDWPAGLAMLDELIA